MQQKKKVVKKVATNQEKKPVKKKPVKKKASPLHVMKNPFKKAAPKEEKQKLFEASKQ